MARFCYAFVVAIYFLVSIDSSFAAEPSTGNETLIDLTHPFDRATIYWPTEQGFQIEKEAFGMTEKGYFYAANRITTAEHGGTRIDAPIHFFAGGETVDQIPLWRLVGPGVCVDVSERSEADRDYLIEGVREFTGYR